MVDAISKITLYVEDQEKAKLFWIEKMDFVIRIEQEMGPGMKWIEVAPDEETPTSFVLYNKAMMQTQNPEVHVGHPSVILSTRDIQSAYQRMKEREVHVGELSEMPYGTMFHFSDPEGNMFLLREDK